MITGGVGDDSIDLGNADGDADTVVFGTTQTLNGEDTITNFVVGTDIIDINFGDGGLANNAALRGNGTDLQAGDFTGGAVVIGIGANAGFLVNNTHALTGTTKYESYQPSGIGLTLNT